jgi:radical SAM superfamily enzyme YgiQ (UPF0313 family)
MFSVLLISLHDSGTYGHRCVSSYLQSKGFSVNNVFFRCNSAYQDAGSVSENELQALRQTVETLTPDLIGINIHSSFGHPVARDVVCALRAFTGVPIILGGVHPTLLPRFCLDDIRADYVCVGEGEETIVVLCRRLQNRESCDDIPGILSRSTVNFVPNPPNHDLDALPFQDVRNDNKYNIGTDGSVIKGEPLLWDSTYPTKASRGCPFQCTYCSARDLRALCGKSGYYRVRSPNHVVTEIAAFIQQNPSCKLVYFWDDTFPFKNAWVAEFAQLYKTRVGLPFHVWLKPNMTKDENIHWLKTAGLKNAVIGVQSASDETRRLVFGRTETTEDILRADAILSKYGIGKTYDFIIDHFWESSDELETTFHLLCRLRKPFYLNMHSLILLPQTELARRAVREGRLTEEDIMKAITADPRTSSRRINWIRGVPDQDSAARRYWLFLVFSSARSFVPVPILRFVASLRFLRRNPDLLGEDMGLVNWIGKEDTLRFSSLFAKSSFLECLLGDRTSLGRWLSQRFLFLEWLARLGHRLPLQRHILSNPFRGQFSFPMGEISPMVFHLYP